MISSSGTTTGLVSDLEDDGDHTMTDGQEVTGQGSGSGSQLADFEEELRKLVRKGLLKDSAQSESDKPDKYSIGPSVKWTAGVLTVLGAVFVAGSVFWLQFWAPRGQNADWYIFPAFLALILTGVFLVIMAAWVLYSGVRAVVMERKMAREDRRWTVSMYMRLAMTLLSGDQNKAAAGESSGGGSGGGGEGTGQDSRAGESRQGEGG